MNDKLYNVGVYIRLSVESTWSDSESIENQREMLTKFIAHMPCWIEKRVYIDDGASGGNFNRKGFQDMMKDVRSGEINLVLVQDLSRFGRNYLEAGRYLEEELPSLGCRFVSLMDGIDTETGENDIMPLLNAMHDLHLKNLSERVKSVLLAKAKIGHKIGRAPYGYKKEANDPTRLIIDEYAAEVVRRIYDMRLSGMGYASIVKTLNLESIVPPLVYYFNLNGYDDSKIKARTWLTTAVKSILSREVYIGSAVQMVNRQVSYRERRQEKTSVDEWVRVENVFPPIIGREAWEAVQEMNRQAAIQSTQQREPRKSLFSGMLVCSGCGRTMVYKPTYYKGTSGQRKEHAYYFCRSYHNSGGTECKRNSVIEHKLKELILTQIQDMSERISIDSKSVLGLLQTRLIGERASIKAEAEREQKLLSRQLQKLEAATAQLYEDRVSGLVSEDAFTETVNKYEAERHNKGQQLAVLEQTEQEAAIKLSDIHNWMRLIQENTVNTDVSRDLLETLIERIEIGESKVEGDEKSQDIRIIYKFVGNLQ